MNDGEKISRRHAVGHPRVIKEKGCRKLSRLVKLSRRQWHPNIIHVLLKCFLRTHFRWTYWIWDYAAKVPLMGISWQYIIVNYSYTRPEKIMPGPWIIGRQLSSRKNHDSSFSMLMDMTEYTVFQASCCSPLYTLRHTEVYGGDIILWGTFSWTSLGPVDEIEQTMKVANYLNITTDKLQTYMVSVFPKWK